MTKKKLAKYVPLNADYKQRLLARLREKIRHGACGSDCHRWIGAVSANGQPMLSMSRRPGSRSVEAVSRVLFEVTRNRAPVGMVARTCTTDGCVNAAHYEDGASMRDVIRHQRERGGGTWSRAKLDESQVRQIREERQWTDVSVADLARRYLVSPQAVSQTCLKQVWKHVPDVEPVEAIVAY